MKNIRMNTSSLLLLFALFLIGSCSKNNEVINAENQSLKKATITATVTTLVPHIVLPRGLRFGPDGSLYVSLAGTGGTYSSIGVCTPQVNPPVGPYTGGNTSSIVKVDPRTGMVSMVASNLPSGLNALGDALGVADVEFIGNQLYALLSGGGCSHANPNTPASVIKVNPDGTWAVIADLSNYLLNNPVAAPEEDDFEPEGSLYSMINVRGDLYVIEPNHGEMIKVTTSGEISRVIDFSAHFGHIVPTAVAYHGNFFVGNLTTFPLIDGAASIYKVTPSGEPKIWATGFTGVLGVAFDQQNRMYVLETSAAPPVGQEGPPVVFGTGRVIRVNNNNTRDVIVDHLAFPTGMTFGPDGALYISNVGFGPLDGQILKVVF
ncbi:MAG TPA: ScyD/ScyE family protein [Prolixibacteraceae bacterium]|jgi:hypothetical protein